MEEAITKFFNGMEGQERSGFTDWHRFLGCLPLPVAKGDSGMSHSKALESGFIPKTDEEEQKRFTLLEFLLYIHALEYRFFVHTLYIHVHTEAFLFIHYTYNVPTRAFLYMHCTYCTMYIQEHFCLYMVHTLYIQKHFCSYIVHILCWLRTVTRRSVQQRLVSVARRIEPGGKLKCVTVFFMFIHTSYHKYRPCIYSVHTQYKVIITNQV
jgi:hypothetical protein